MGFQCYHSAVETYGEGPITILEGRLIGRWAVNVDKLGVYTRTTFMHGPVSGISQVIFASKP